MQFNNNVISTDIYCIAHLDTNGAHARAAATVGNTERLVQVQMRHVSTNIAGAALKHL